MTQIIKHRRGSLESLSSVTGSLQKGEIVIASGSSNISSTNGSTIVFAVPENGSVRAVNRVLRGNTAPNIFSGSIYNGMLDGVPYYASSSTQTPTLYLISSSFNESINLIGNIQPFSTSVDSRLVTIETSIGGGGSLGTRVTNLELVSQSIQNFTSSQNAKDIIIGAYTASMNTFTGSQEAKDVIISAYTASMNTFTSSQNAKDVTISAYTASMNTFSASIYAFTSSQEAKNTTLQTYTSSLNATIARIQESTASLNSYTASNDTTNTAQNARLSRLEESTASLNAYSASLKTAITASGVDITVNGNTTIKGNLTVQGTQTSVDSTTINLGDNILQLNAAGTADGGLIVRDATGGSTTSGSLLWDVTNDYWKAGAVGSEERILRAGSDTVVSGSSQITITNTTGFTTYSSSVSASVTSLSASVAAGNIWQRTGSAYNTINNIEITGSLNVSGTINADNTTVGIPTSNAWQSNLNGSYFNNFTSETNVSEILRFVAGLLSSSAPDASPNTRTLGSVTTTGLNTSSGTALTGRIPQSSTNATITYLASKGFATAGSTIFSGVGTIYTAGLGYNYSSVAAGTTVATSSADAQLFGLGLLSSGTPTNFKVSGSFTFRFKDNSAKTDTATSQSVVTLTQTGAGTTNGVSLALINTVNPAVIPPGYQDGKFANVMPQYLYSGSATAVSASGYYHISSSFQIASGSSPYSTATQANGSEIFWAPLTTIATNVPAQTVYTASVSTLAYVSAVSRSLSGAPYLSQSTYVVSSSISGAFAPLFFNGTVAAHSLSGTGMTQTSGVTSVATSAGTISTANAVYDSTNTTVRATGVIPTETDLIRLNGLYTFGGANITNVTQTSFTPTTFTVSAVGYDYNGAADTYSNTLSYHTAGGFGQTAASGSLAYYTRTQGTDSATNSGSSNLEPFTGENFRMVLNDSLLTFTGTSWTTTFALNQLGGNDLQVKPGYLVKPGGTYGYWIGDPDPTKTYKYYVRRFTTNGATKTAMTLNLGQTLVNWTATTNNSIAVGLLFQSSKNPTYANARIYDPSDLTNNFIATQTANTDGMNPFGSNIGLYGNTGGSLLTNTYTIPLRNADGMTLDATNTSVYVIVRYKGDPTPSTSMTVTFS